MKIEKNELTVSLIDAQDFSPELIFECGQAFRWKRGEDGAYVGIAFGAPLKVIEEDSCVSLKCASENDFENIWHRYFDLENDYNIICSELSDVPKLAPAVEYGRGIRILRQDFWEALCSFIISQCNNIPRIKGIVESLCRNFGEPVLFEGEELYTFPTAEDIAAIDENELGVIRSGYRAKYIINAQRLLLMAIFPKNYWIVWIPILHERH